MLRFALPCRKANIQPILIFYGKDFKLIWPGSHGLNCHATNYKARSHQLIITSPPPCSKAYPQHTIRSAPCWEDGGLIACHLWHHSKTQFTIHAWAPLKQTLIQRWQCLLLSAASHVPACLHHRNTVFLRVLYCQSLSGSFCPASECCHLAKFQAD